MKRSMFESQEPFPGNGYPGGQSVGSGADVTIPKETFLYIEKNLNGNYSVSGISNSGLGISQLWEVPYEDLPGKVKSELDMGKEFPGAGFNLEKNEDVRRWAERSFTQAYNEGRLSPGRVNGEHEILPQATDYDELARSGGRQFYNEPAVPEHSLLAVTRVEGDNPLRPEADDTYRLQVVTKDGNRTAGAWALTFEELPDNLRNMLLRRDPNRTFTADLDKNQSLRQWVAGSYDSALNTGRVEYPVSVSESEMMSIPDVSEQIKDSLQETQQEELSRELLQQLRSDARSTLLSLDKPERQETPKAAVDRSSLEKLDINRKVDGKYTMTAVFNGTAVTREASASEVMNLMAASPQEKVNTVAQIFNRPEIANPAMAEGTKEKITEAVAEFTQTATPESVSRPEIYASKTEHVSDMATNMQAAASASYNDIQQQQQSQEQSRTRSEGLGM